MLTFRTQRLRSIGLVRTVGLSAGLGMGLLSCAPQGQNYSPIANTRTIVGGTLVEENSEISASSVLIIADLAPTLGFTICSGTLIAKHLVITAAHCILRDDDPSAPFPADQVDLYFGDTHFDYTNRIKTITNDRARRKAFKIIVHENHIGHEQTHDANDIALIEFQGDLPSELKPAELLPISRANFALDKNIRVTSAGFGITQLDETPGPLRLRQTELTVDTDEGDAIVHLTTSQPGYHGVCPGDSGGPTFVQIAGRSYLWAINIKSNCMTESWVIRLADFYEWIQKKSPISLR